MYAVVTILTACRCVIIVTDASSLDSVILMRWQLICADTKKSAAGIERIVSAEKSIIVYSVFYLE